ncbi:MAG: Hpt domain-containing protein [Bacteroidales bacterium]|nr:Hpt domain-containing protein [Bacteroidales bacterium]
MTLQECYAQLNGSYETALSRLMNDRLVDKFIRKFPADTTMQQLRDAVAQTDRQLAFRAAHTLKGVAANLSFTELQNAASNLTEQLRSLDQDPDMSLFETVEAAYNKTMTALNTYIAE